ncbi:hypothetical protein Q1695_000870 [Nippostrongylus brasiliensis]|nr:hypothetical protein Q1695_000870 [Nippostrongylus brasiliensis]
MLLLIWMFPIAAIAQSPYGPSQLDQYARLINSGNLGGFGFFQNALSQGTVRGLGDLNPPPLLTGLPPLPLTHEEVLRQLTSTLPPIPTRPTAAPTTPPTNPGGVYAVNAMVELPPMPENRIHGTFDDDGVFHPDNAANTEDKHIVRNQIQGTKIREFSQTDRDTVEGKREENSSKDEDYQPDESKEDRALSDTSDAEVRRQAQFGERIRKPRQNSDQRLHPQSRAIKYFDSSANIHQQQARRLYQQQQTQEPQQRQSVPNLERYPPFVFRPKAPPLQREPEYNNLLAEIEEYDDFLEQQRVYRARYPNAALQNPYRDLPSGQLPAAGSYTV